MTGERFEMYETDTVRAQELRELLDLGRGVHPTREQRLERMGDPLPPLPPVSHTELGRGGFSFPSRRRDPFAGASNAVAAGEPQPVLTVESLEALLTALPPEPVVIVHKPSGVGMTERQFLDALFGIPLPIVVPFEEPEKIGTAVPVRHGGGARART